MHIIGINSSPRDSQTSKTARLLAKFLEGAGRAGATTEIIHLRRHRIEPCIGCFSCWSKTPGRCVQPDDMTKELLGKFLEAEVAVLASPIYFYHLNACMKAFLDRTLPLFDPSRGEDPEQLPLRFGRLPRIVALSVCGSWDTETFQILSQNLRTIFRTQLVAEMYRHTSECLDIPLFQEKIEQILAAAAQAGEEIVVRGQIAPATLEIFTQDLAPKEVLQQMAKEYWQQLAASAGQTS